MSHQGADKPDHADSAGAAKAHGHGHPHAEEIPKVDVAERGGKDDSGNQRTLDRRLFVQLMVFDLPGDAKVSEAISQLGEELNARGVEAVIYHDVNAPRGFGLVSYSDDPAMFVEKVRPAVLALKTQPVQRHDSTMLGRSYASGHETDLPFWLIDRPKGVIANAAWNWAVWYPLRRNGGFAKLDGREQAAILREHAIIGRSYGAADLAHDVRLACHGLDANDNEFVIGLIGKDLHPLSHVVQAMRKTRQTSEFIVQMGPFFVGQVAWRSMPKA